MSELLNGSSEKVYNEVFNNLKTNPEINLKTVSIKINNNEHFVDNQQEKMVKTEGIHKLGKTGVDKLKLIIPKDTMNKTSVNALNISNDLSKKSALCDKNSISIRGEILNYSQIECSNPVTDAHNFFLQYKPQKKYKAPIMGTNILLAKANKDNSISAVIHDLVIQRYNDALNRYLERRIHRRCSKTDSESSSEGSNASSQCLDRYYIPSPKTSSSTSTATVEDHDEIFNFMSERRNVIHSETLSLISNVEESYEEKKSENESEDRKWIIENNGKSSSENINEQKNSEVEYDIEKFLSDALGDELGYASVDSQDKGCESCDNDKPQIDENSVATTDVSTLLSKEGTLHIYKPIKKTSTFDRSPTKMPSTFFAEDTSFAENNHDYLLKGTPEVEKLMKKILIQNEIIFQTSKALSFCKSAKEFVASVEHIEAERILLVALSTKEALNNELNRMEYETYIEDYSASSGTVTIANIKFPMKKDIFPEEVKSPRGFTEHFVCIISSGKTVLASGVIKADKNGFVNINRSFTFVSLPANFEIDVCMFCMRVKNKLRTFSHESKFHLNKNIENLCLSPKKLFQVHRNTKSYKVTNEVLSIMPSSFSLWGKYSIKVQDLPRPANFKMHTTPLSSTLSGTFTASITSEIELHNKVRGFLTIATENSGCTLWSRRWCVLKGSDFKYWNYPSEENTTEPVGHLNLRHCTDNVSVAGRNRCARPRTLVLHIGSQNGDQTKYLLSADSMREIKEWEKEFNLVINTLRNWNCINLLL